MVAVGRYIVSKSVGFSGDVLLQLGVTKGDRVALYAVNKPRWTETDLAIKLRGAITVPLYSNLGPDRVRYVLNHSGMLLGALHLCPRVRGLVSLQPFDRQSVLDEASTLYVPSDPAEDIGTDTVVDTERETGGEGGEGYRVVQTQGYEDGCALSSAPASPILLTDLDTLQSAMVYKAVPEDASVSPSDPCAIFYTSGTTGRPKGVVQSHRTFLITSAAFMGAMPYTPTGADLKSDPSLASRQILYSYLPTAHVFSHAGEITALMNGYSIGYFSGSLERMAEDCQALRPTVMGMVPMIANRLHTAVVKGVEGKGGIGKAVFNLALSRKLKGMQTHGVGTDKGRGRDWLWDRLVFSKTSALLGGRLQHIAIGAALLTPSVGRFTQCILCCGVVAGYGSTESGSLGSVTTEGETDYSGVGTLFPNIEARVVSHPPLGYEACPQDGTNPSIGYGGAIEAAARYIITHSYRGELQLRGPTVFTGYYKNPSASAACFEDGWYKTDDMVEIMEGGRIRLIGRSSRIVKQVHGEYLNLETVEDTLLDIPIVAQIYLHSECDMDRPVAVVVPDEDVLRSMLSASSLPLDPSAPLATLYTDPTVTHMVLERITEGAKALGLLTHEIPIGIALEAHEWTPDDYLTPTFKKRLRLLQMKYAQTFAGIGRDDA
ncbi:hypothetical protein KIPB_003228 [Kipferlia bialata]|uniref:AMP-dependent synthetase/ligase domain-containing protein n=1 Tax=Kipferlia bialata TaxID=797122 RepID=A0A9K3CRX4_9EUKA|nr:hypothetical protein KIPB_003228 [Kipferlia bialata]|eukprot:g3228.t1